MNGGFLRFAAVLLGGLLVAAAARADAIRFLQTGPNVTQDTTLRAKVLRSTEVPGLLVMVGSAIEIQQFHPAYVRRSEKPLSFFLAYDPIANRYTTVQVGGKVYKINEGSFFSIELGGVRVSVDNRNPYVSIVSEDSKNLLEPGIVGFRGLETVVNNSGTEVIALLEANQLYGVQDVIKPYTISTEELLLEGKPIRTGRVGIAVTQPNNPCFNSEGVVFLGDEDRKALLEAPKATQLKFLQEVLSRDDGSRTPFENLLTLRVTKEEIIGLDYGRKSRVRVIKNMKSTSRYVVCSVRDIAL